MIAVVARLDLGNPIGLRGERAKQFLELAGRGLRQARHEATRETFDQLEHACSWAGRGRSVSGVVALSGGHANDSAHRECGGQPGCDAWLSLAVIREYAHQPDRADAESHQSHLLQRALELQPAMQSWDQIGHRYVDHAGRNEAQ